MKTKVILVLFIALNLLSCSKDSNDDQTPSFTFQVEVQNVTDRSATITWTRPEGSNISYQIFLNDELIEDNFSQTAYTFNGLTSETSYNGKITASNGSQTTSVNVSFITDIFIPRTFVGDVYLQTQEEVNAFGNNHYNIIEGRLDIGTYGPIFNIVDLSPLNDLLKVTQYMLISNTVLENLEGLNNLKEIGGYFQITHNDKLLNLNGLGNLEKINSYLHIHRNPILKNVDGLTSLNAVEGVSFFYNLELESVNFLNQANSGYYLTFDDNPSLKTISGFRNMKSLTSALIINNNDALLNFEGFNSMEYINAELIIVGNDKLEALNLQNLKTVNNSLTIGNNNSLTSLDGLNNLIYVREDFEVSTNPLLSDFCAVSQFVINQGFGSLYIEDNLYNPTAQDFINGDCSQ